MPWPKGKAKPIEWRRKVSEKLRRVRTFCAYCGKEFKRRGIANKYCSQRCSGCASSPKGICPPQLHTPEAREKSRLARIGLRYPPEVNKKKASRPMLGKKHKPETIRKLSEIAKAKMNDPNHVKLLFQKLNMRPNKAELKLQGILDHYFPHQWKYTGDGSVIINYLNPDFININGKKVVIELFGEYHHNLPNQPWHHSELGRIMAFNSFGFKCLVIWSNELRNEESMANKVSNFMKRRRVKK